LGSVGGLLDWLLVESTHKVSQKKNSGMGPKKKEGKAAQGEVVEGEDPLQLLQNYQKFCK
jgi:hypothetical protein